MKKQLLILTLFAIIGWSNSATAQSPSWIWAKSASATEHDGGTSVATDASGNVYVTGSFNSPTITFGTTTLTNAGGNDIFIVKYDANGNVLWAMSAGGAGDERGNSVSTDSGGNVFMTGFFDSPAITFGTTILPNAGGFYPYDIFIVKYDAGGNVLWAKRAGGSYPDQGNSVSTDTSGNVIMTGYFASTTITFGTITLTNLSGPSTIGPSDIFIVKYDENGNVLWATNGGSPSDEQGNSVSTDAGGNVFITGWFSGPDIIFGTDTLYNSGNLTFYNYDIYIVKYDANGNVLWAKSAGGTDSDNSNRVSTDAIGNVFMTGYFDSPAISFGTTTLTNAGLRDIFIVKYDAGGNVLWVKSAGGAYIDNGTSVSTDASGNVFITGYFDSPTITFGTTTLTRNGLFSDIYIVKYDAGGNVLWAKSAGGIDIDGGNSLSTDAGGNVFITGYFHSPSITFGTTTLINSGAPGTTYDIFIAKLDTVVVAGIASNQSSNGISVFPNPAKNVLTISYPLLTHEDLTITITDITGKIIYKTIATATQKIEVNTSDFAEGVYLVQIQTEKFIETKKVIVTK
ncbi:MAG: T9SS type A sorting domain-containing protein [Bacteroidetes bacterium]|nr:T9SS type A sorting domain-containing protein [Bacteroidota bacterium]